MKTDLERFVELYASFGINCKVATIEDGFIIELCQNERDSRYEGPTVSDKFTGWPSSYGDVQFDKEGKFVSQGFWE